ncbi:Flp family type IVb pilin [Sphingomonas sp. PR090111-T3T-6A]|uniref:Flp family type IVb pilin n=1 Tax=Sphingomonas sp. PR090111-T3T-6A TaxID=685778 RepID=UPI00056955E8|nr:Flp family type IVb pilin [Sphingomonas sp. PR090111-T3T-6A]
MKLDQTQRQGTSVRIIGKLTSDQRGGTAIEYGLICALIVLAIMGSVQLFASKAVGMLNHVANEASNVE